MMGLLLLACFRGFSKCVYGVIRDATLRKSEFDTCDTCDNKREILGTLTTLATLKV
jgi:hypothetical protein